MVNYKYSIRKYLEAKYTDNQSILVDARCNYFAIMTIKPWNSLPASSILSNSFAIFNCTLNSTDIFLFVRQVILN